jgi:hypothetical protein
VDTFQLAFGEKNWGLPIIHLHLFFPLLKWHIGKNIVKGATHVSGHSLKLHFCMFERSPMKHNSLDWSKNFGIFFINCIFYMIKFWHKSKIFLHVQSTQTSRVDNFNFFSNGLFFYQMCTIPLKNWRGF